MSSLNLSTNGPSISKSYQSVVNAAVPSGLAGASPTYGQWAIFAVSAPLANAFQQASANKESVLKVQSTGEGELIDMIDEFSDGRIQFAYVKVKDSNSGLPKNALIAWCGEGVPERTKGYFTSHLTAVAKLLHGYHVQITARSDRDLTPEGIIQKVADSSGSKYSAGDAPPPVAATKPSVSSKPAFTPTQSSAASSGYSTLTRTAAASQRGNNVDADGWGADAPPVTRTQLEKVQSAYKPTKVDMRELTAQKPTSSTTGSARPEGSEVPNVIGGGYQPVGKVDIAAIRRQARDSGPTQNDRPDIVKGSYEPVGKVDIAAIRAKAQGPTSASVQPPESISPAKSGDSEHTPEQRRSVSDRSAAFSGSERLTSLPKPKVSNKFGGSSFTGTRAPLPGSFEGKGVSAAAPVGAASRSFADQGGKTPAQIWAEKKARERGASGSEDVITSRGQSPQSPMKAQASGGGEWKSGYAGKSWAPIQTSHTGRSASSSVEAQRTGDLPPQVEEENEADSPPATGISSLRDRFSGAAPMGAPAPAATFDRAAPEPDTSNKPNRGIPIPGLPSQSSQEAPQMPSPPPQPPRSPTPPTPEMRSTSPIRVAMPVSRSAVANAREEQMSPPPSMPVRSLATVIPDTEPEDDEPDSGPDPGRAAAQTTAVASLGHDAVNAAPSPATGGVGGERAKAEYDYEAAEDNEVSLREGEIVTNIERVDPDWWVVTNESGHSGLVPSNYLTALTDEAEAPTPLRAAAVASSAPEAMESPTSSGPGITATALYDYEAAEDNEISFQEGEKVTDIDKVDADWYLGTNSQNQRGLFPGNYVDAN